MLLTVDLNVDGGAFLASPTVLGQAFSSLQHVAGKGASLLVAFLRYRLYPLSSTPQQSN